MALSKRGPICFTWLTSALGVFFLLLTLNAGRAHAQEEDEVNCLATVLMSEASIGTYEERVAVAWTVFNRVHSASFPDTICEVVYQPKQYATNKQPTAEIVALAKKLTVNPEPDPTQGSTHFFSPRSMPKEGDPTTGFDVGGGLHIVPGILQRVYFPSWTKTMTWAGDIPNVRQVYYMFYTPVLKPTIDVYLLVDLTGSFIDDLPRFKAEAPKLIANLQASHPDIRFGLGKFEDYPIPPFGVADLGDRAYQRLIDLTTDASAVLSAISGLSSLPYKGDDEPESQLAALFQAATGKGQVLAGLGYPQASIPEKQQANFRANATKVIVLWTDAPFHQPNDPGTIPYPGPSWEETEAALATGGISKDIRIFSGSRASSASSRFTKNSIKVIGISSGLVAVPDLQRIARATGALAPAQGVDCNKDGVVDVAAGEPLVCTIALTGEGITAAIEATVAAVATPPTIEQIIASYFEDCPKNVENSAKIICQREIELATWHYLNKTPIPDTDDLTIDQQTLKELIAYYLAQTPVDQPLPGSNPEGVEQELKALIAVFQVPQSHGLNIRAVSVAFNQALNNSFFRFTVVGSGIKTVKLEIYDLAGRTVYNSAEVQGTTLVWQLKDSTDNTLANGVYLCVVTIRGSQQEVVRSQVKKLAILK